MAAKNYNIRFRNGKTDEDRAWEHLHSEEVRHSFRSQNGFVIAAINDFYDRHLCISKDPYGGYMINILIIEGYIINQRSFHANKEPIYAKLVYRCFFMPDNTFDNNHL